MSRSQRTGQSRSAIVTAMAVEPQEVCGATYSLCTCGKEIKLAHEPGHWVRPASPDSDVVKGVKGPQVDREEKRTSHQSPKARRCLHDQAGYMTASVPIHASFKSPLTSLAGPYMTTPVAVIDTRASTVRSPM